MAHSNETQRDLMRPFFNKFLQFLLCNLGYKCPNWTDSERLDVELDLKLPSLFHYEQIVGENSILNEWKFYRSVQLWSNTSRFTFPGTFSKRLKLIADGF